MIEDFKLLAFSTVARLGSFTAAAKELGVSQPAISQNVADLERVTNSKLIDRSKAKIALTARGLEFLNQVDIILDSYKKLESDFVGAKTTLIKNVLFDKQICNIYIENGRFIDLDAPLNTPADKVIDGTGLAIIPSFFNTHNHAAMTLLRSYADDMPLQTWLEDYIWPYEATLTPEKIREGSDIAVSEMISSGTTFFNDMYFDIEQTIKSVQESGMRAAIGITIFESNSKAVEESRYDFARNFVDPTGGKIQLVVAPHAIYTVGTERLKKAANFARRHNLKLHIHLSETEKEVKDCFKEHGMSPVKYLDSIGFLGPDVIAAHCVHIDTKDWALLSRRGVTVSHCPCSNMKLGSGRFPYELALDAGCRITLGTDGASSNNCLDMLSEMKTAALLAKVGGNPELLGANEVFRWATLNAAQAFGINAGEIAVGKLADCVLLDLSKARMQPCHNLIANVVYSADSSVVKYVMCEGKIIGKYC